MASLLRERPSPITGARMTVNPSEGYSGKCRALFFVPKGDDELSTRDRKDWERRKQIDA
jgi:hypothetical protein